MRTIDYGDDDDRIAIALANDFIKVIQERIERSLQGEASREPVPVIHALTILVANAITMYAPRTKAAREAMLGVFVDAVRQQLPSAVKNVRAADNRFKKPH